MRKIWLLSLLLISSIAWGDSESTIGGRTGTDHIIQANGVSLRPRAYLNITGDTVTGSDSGGKTVITMSGLTSASADTLYIRKDGTSTTTAQIPFAVGASFTQPNGAGASNVGIKIVGGSQDGTSDSGGMALYSTHNASGNRQFVITSTDNVGSSSAAGFRFLSGTGIANIDGITGNGGTRLPANFGTDTSDIAVGNNSLAYNATLRGKLDIYTEASKVGLVVGSVSGGTAQSSDYLQIKNTSGTNLAKIDSSGNITSPTYISTISTGTAPLTVSSTTQVTNLNASQLQGFVTGTSGGTIPLLNGTNTASGVNTFSNTTDSSTSVSGAVKISGGLGVAKKIYAGTSVNVQANPTTGNNISITPTQEVFTNSGGNSATLSFGGTDLTLTVSGVGAVGFKTPTLTMNDPGNIVFGTTTGTKIGTATTQKLAFYNSTPIVKPTGNALTALSNLGLVGSPTLTATNVGLTNVDNYRQWHSLASEWTDAQDSGSGIETDLYLNSLDKSVWTIDGQGSQFVYGGLIEGAVATTQQIKVYFDGQVIFDTGSLAVVSGHPYWKIVVDATMIPSTSHGRFTTSWMFQDASYPTDVQYVELSGLNFGSPIDVKITGTSSGSPQVTVFHDNLSWKPKTTDG